MNNNQYIKSLLDKYWEGETSLSEEQALKDYFKSGHVADHLKEYQGLFDFYSLEASKVSSIDMKKLLDKQSSNHSAKIRPLRGWLVSVAAAVTLLVSAVWLYNQKETLVSEDYVYEVEDPEEALEITKDALAFLSIKFDESSKTINTNVQKIKAARKFK